MAKSLAPFLLALLLLFVSLPATERAAAKGLGVEPRLGSPGTQVTLMSLLPGRAPDGEITIALAPQEPSPGDCSAVLAKVVGKPAEGVSPESWELSVTTATIPETLACAEGAAVPVEPGMYWIEARGVQIEGRPDFPQELLRVPFGVPAFSEGTIGRGFPAGGPQTGLAGEGLHALARAFPGPVTDVARGSLGSSFVLTLQCSAGCYESGYIQAFYWPLLTGTGGVVAFNPEGPFYRLESDSLNEALGTVARAPAETAEPAAAPSGRDWAPYVVASVAGGLAFAAASFAAGTLLGRRRSRRLGS